MSSVVAITHRQPLGGRRLAKLTVDVGLATLIVAMCVQLVIKLLAAHGAFLFDWRGDLYTPGQAILHGHNPYREGYVAHLAALKRANGTVGTTFAVAVTPAPVILAFAPLSVLGPMTSGVVFVLLSIAAVIFGLRLLGVRDWRCTALALVSWPTVFGLYLGNESQLILLGIAVIWRWREKLWPPALAFASILLLKLYPWLLGGWMLVTRRFRQLALAVALVAIVTPAAWAVLGFAGMTGYPHMLSNLDYVLRGVGPSFATFLMAAGANASTANAAALGLAVLMLLLAWRIGSRPGGEGRGFGLAVMACLIGSPLVWEHYFVLLFVPIALVSPRLSALWFLPALTGLVPTPNAHSPAQLLFWLALQGIVTARLCLAGGELQGGVSVRRLARTIRSLNHQLATESGGGER
jgi:hypothetical protein